MKRQIIALLMILVMLIGVMAGCKSTGTDADPTATPKPTSAATDKPDAGTDTEAPEEVGKLLDEPVTFDMWIIEHASYMYEKDLFLERALGERLNVFFNVTPFQDGFGERVNLALSSGDLPDILFYPNLSQATDWGMQGALVDITEYLDEMPNYTAWAESMGDYPNYYYSANGSLYMMPQHGFGTASNSTFWIYRKDLFDKHGLEAPKNEQELYEVSKALKAEYPDSYPFCNRSWVGAMMDRISYQFGSGNAMYYSNKEQAWVYGAREEGYRKAVEWLAKMYEEELMPPNILSLDTAGWQELISTSKGFMFSDYQARIDFYNSPMREEDPSVTFAYMPPWEGGGSGVKTFNPQSQLIISGYAGTTTSEHIPEMIKFFDWLYTDEAKELMSWGIEGETYTVNADGTKSHIGIQQGSSSFDYMTKFGFFQRGFWCITDPLAHITYASDETLEAVERVLTDSGEYRIPAISFSEANQERYAILSGPIGTLHDEMIGKFITGQRPISEYDDFLAELDALGLQDLIDLYNAQQAEINASR
jgi:putative aldouronate transport system substrate-binding protein